MKALIIEDEPIQRLEREFQMRSLGFEYTSCSDATTALQAYQKSFYPLIVTDRGLPDMDGLELCRHIRALPEGEKSIILMISGSDETQEIQEAIAAGADDFLRKPADWARVRERITVLMERIHQRAAVLITK